MRHSSVMAVLISATLTLCLGTHALGGDIHAVVKDQSGAPLPDAVVVA